jgi:hypothetical protein
MDNDKPQPQYIDDDAKIFFEMWLKDQYDRYEKVKEAVEPHFTAMGKILPYDKLDFMKWFVKKAKSTDDYLTIKIEDYHFEEYYQTRLRGLTQRQNWEGLFNELRKSGYIEATAEVFNHIMEYRQIPVDKKRILWLTSKADAIAFQESFGFTMPQFNKCFQSNDGRKFTLGSKSSTERSDTLKKILTHFNTKTRL